MTSLMQKKPTTYVEIYEFIGMPIGIGRDGKAKITFKDAYKICEKSLRT